MTTTDAQTTPYTISAELPVSPDEAFALVTEPERLRRWKTVSATVDLRAGGGYRFTVTPGHVVSGTYRVVEPGRRVVFGWGWEGGESLPPDASTVTVTIEPTETGSRVTIEHAGLDAEQAAGHAAGWEHFVERLQRLAATGDAGPDEWAAAPGPDRPARRGGGHPRGPAAGAPRPDGRGPAEADPVLRLHLPRRGGAPDGVAARRRGHVRRGRRAAGVRQPREQGQRAGRPGGHRPGGSAGWTARSRWATASSSRPRRPPPCFPSS